MAREARTLLGVDATSVVRYGAATVSLSSLAGASTARRDRSAPRLWRAPPCWRRSCAPQVRLGPATNARRNPVGARHLGRPDVHVTTRYSGRAAPSASTTTPRQPRDRQRGRGVRDPLGGRGADRGRRPVVGLSLRRVQASRRPARRDRGARRRLRRAGGQGDRQRPGQDRGFAASPTRRPRCAVWPLWSHASPRPARCSPPSSGSRHAAAG